MKNSPDQEWLNKLSARLAGYSEEPDEGVWHKLFAATHHRPEPYWVPWVHRAEAVTFVVLLIWSLTVFTGQPRRVYKKTAQHPETVAKEKSSSGKIAEATQSGHVEMKGSSIGMNNPGSARGLREEIALARQYPMIVDRHNSTSFFSLSEIKLTMSPLVIRQTASADSSARTTQDKIPPDERRKEAPIFPARKKRPLVFYGSVSPSLGYQKIIPFENDGVSVESFYRKRVFSEDRFGLSVEGGLQWQVGRRLEVYSGFSLYSQSQMLAYHYVSAENGNLAQQEDFTYAVVPGKTMKRVNYSMLNVGVDLGFIYHLKGDDLMHKIGGSVSWQHGVRESRNTESYNNAKSQYLFYQVFYRNEYVVNNRLNVFIQPFYKHVLFSGEKMDEPFEVRPYYGGMTVGVVYRMR